MDDRAVLVNTGNARLDTCIKDWIRLDQNDKTKQEVLSLAERQEVDKLSSMMFNRLVFGTAGIRGKMEAGFSGMNDLVIIQTSQGMAKYMMEACPAVKERGVVIGYDGRYHSHRFAKLTALAFLSLEIPVYLFSKMTPTPFIPFSVLHLQCDAGIMITASHNPKMDNGFKVYWSNGAQIISPHDKGIQQSILANLETWPNAWSVSSLDEHREVVDPFQKVSDAYMQRLEQAVHYKNLNKSCNLTFTYTAMHGVGYDAVCKAVGVFGFNKPFIPVVEQVSPDPEFPTVKFPNPEEGKSALDLSIRTADSNNSTVILANDPDADRLAVAEKQEGGDWKVFTGDELGALLGWYCWHCYKLQHPDDDGSDVYMISSTVSSKILQAIAKKEGFHTEETLTGFKWMANKCADLMSKGKTVLFAFEEAIGFMVGTAVLDKDGISAALTAAEMATYLKSQNRSLQQQLEQIYDIYGHHICSNSYFICYEQPTISTMFNRLRNWDGIPNTYPKTCGEFEIKHVRDLSTGFDSRRQDLKATLPASKSSEMITFYFTNGVVATMRTSGTEPKIKYYTEMCADPSQRNQNIEKPVGRSESFHIIRGGSREDLVEELKQLVTCLIKEFFEPEKNKLLYRTA